MTLKIVKLNETKDCFLNVRFVVKLLEVSKVGYGVNMKIKSI